MSLMGQKRRRNEQRQQRPSGEIWLHEIKHDGFRVIARKDGIVDLLDTTCARGTHRHTVPLAAIGLFSVPLASTVFYSSCDQVVSSKSTIAKFASSCRPRLRCLPCALAPGPVWVS